MSKTISQDEYKFPYKFLPVVQTYEADNISDLLITSRNATLTRHRTLDSTISYFKNRTSIEPFYAIVMKYISDMIKFDKDTGLSTYADLITNDQMFDYLYGDFVPFDVDLSQFDKFKSLEDIIVFVYLKTKSLRSAKFVNITLNRYY